MFVGEQTAVWLNERRKDFVLPSAEAVVHLTSRPSGGREERRKLFAGLLTYVLPIGRSLDGSGRW
ncbi:MAG: hypothetical protein ACTS4V_00855 [Candidatus Hodgkinia cicadicola]